MPRVERASEYERHLRYLVLREAPFITLARSCCFAVYLPFFLRIFEQRETARILSFPDNVTVDVDVSCH